jgi:hypothetical protein
MLNPLLTAAYSISPLFYPLKTAPKVTISNIPNGTVLSNGTLLAIL